MEVNGWRTFLHPLFEKQLEKLTRQVERLKARDPKGYDAHPSTKILTTIHYYIREGIPSDPDGEDFRPAIGQGHWFRAKFHGRYRLYFKFARDPRVIIYVWVGDDSRVGAFGKFRSILERGEPWSL